MTERSFMAVWLAFIAGLIGLAGAFALLPDVPRSALEFDLQTTSSGLIKIYIDQGRGYNETDTASVVVEATVGEHLAIPIRYARYRSIRLDPDLPGGSFVISNPKITGYFGAKPLHVGRQLGANIPITINANSIAGEVPSDKVDPQFILTGEPQILANDTSHLRKAIPFIIPLAVFAIVFLVARKLPPGFPVRHCTILAGLFLPFAIFFDLSILGYWLVKPEWLPSTGRFGFSSPVADPAAGAFQDYPWLTYIGRQISGGNLPTVNTLNGTGAPLLESLQSGVLYPINLVLPFFDLSQPDFFGHFMLLHVSILFGGCYLLSQRYCEQKLAVVLSASFCLAPLTFSALNMVHFRAFVWMPYLAWSFVRLANSTKVTDSILIGAGAIGISLTAGNPQETILGIVAAFIIYIAEKIRVAGPPRLKDLPAPLIAGASGILIGLPSILPYIISKGGGGLASVEAQTRSATYIAWEWWPAAVLPSYQGIWPFVFKHGRIHDDFALFSITPTVSFLSLCSISMLFSARIQTREAVALWIVVIAALLGFFQIFGGIPYNPIRYVPVLNTIRITKYINYIHLLLFFGACIGCMLLIKADSETRKRAIKGGIFAIALLAGLAIVTAIADASYSATFRKLFAVAPVWIGSILAIAGISLLVLSTRTTLGTLLFLISIVAVRPYGFESGDLTVPHPSSFWNASARSGRVLTRETANQNLIAGYDSLTVFDPVLNKYLAKAMTDSFQVEAPAFNPRPTTPIFDKRQVAVLGLLGVTHLQGYVSSDRDDAAPVAGGLQRLSKTLFPGVVVSKNVAQKAESYCAAGDFTAALATLDAGTASRAVSVRREANSFVIEFPAGAHQTFNESVLIVPVTFSRTWTIMGSPGSIFCRYISQWDGSTANQSVVRIAAIPSGLAPGCAIAFGTALLLLATATLQKRRDWLRGIAIAYR
ncbi:hypothetical protein ACETIH_16905 [Microvirga arabica]|uniref:YfhO family protein n=1 Tax=Microvirga arabica TaxID=1128671 RepID=A0ABV6YAQ3_9HYPH